MIVENKKVCAGFTLIEVIVAGVLIAILGIAATVIYSGYIQETRQETVDTIAQTAAVSANSLIRKTGQNLAAADSSKLDLFFPDPGRFSITIKPESGTLHGRITVTDTRHKVTADAAY